MRCQDDCGEFHQRLSVTKFFARRRRRATIVWSSRPRRGFAIQFEYNALVDDYEFDGENLLFLAWRFTGFGSTRWNICCMATLLSRTCLKTIRILWQNILRVFMSQQVFVCTYNSQRLFGMVEGKGGAFFYWFGFLQRFEHNTFDPALPW